MAHHQEPLKAKSATCAKLVPKASDFTAFESEFAWEEEASNTGSTRSTRDIPPDDRQLVHDTREVPFRWVCSVRSCGTFPASTKKKPAVFRGSGSLIGPRHVLTSAHSDTRNHAEASLRRHRHIQIHPLPVIQQLERECDRGRSGSGGTRNDRGRRRAAGPVVRREATEA